MKVEKVGWYRTRGGQVVKVYRIEKWGKRPVQGYFNNPDDFEDWYIDGKFTVHRETDIDLVKYLGRNKPKS